METKYIIFAIIFQERNEDNPGRGRENIFQGKPLAFWLLELYEQLGCKLGILQDFHWQILQVL